MRAHRVCARPDHKSASDVRSTAVGRFSRTYFRLGRHAGCMSLTGVGPPLATPFDAAGDVDAEALADLVGWVEPHVDFLVPCGSTGEVAKLDDAERARVIETVADAADVPVVAGTGTPGLAPTLSATRRAAEAGADAAMVVTPYYREHDQATLERYYTDVADAAPLPVYLYSVPAYTGVALEPETVASLSDHANVAGLKDSSGDLAALQRCRDRTADDVSLLVGHGGLLAPALDAGADGGILALANVVPAVAAVHDRHARGDRASARALNRELVELNHAVTEGFGIAGLKAAMRARGAPAGRPREPASRLSAADRERVEALVDAATAALPG